MTETPSGGSTETAEGPALAAAGQESETMEARLQLHDRAADESMYIALEAAWLLANAREVDAELVRLQREVEVTWRSLEAAHDALRQAHAERDALAAALRTFLSAVSDMTDSEAFWDEREIAREALASITPAGTTAASLRPDASP